MMSNPALGPTATPLPCSKAESWLGAATGCPMPLVGDLPRLKSLHTRALPCCSTGYMFQRHAFSLLLLALTVLSPPLFSLACLPFHTPVPVGHTCRQSYAAIHLVLSCTVVA